MPTSHQEITLLNHKGAVALACGNDKIAHRIFKGIVEAMGILSAAPEATTGAQGALQTNVLSSVPVPDLQDERFFIFGEVLLYQINVGNSLPSLLDLCLCSCVSLFNMALTYHRRALLTGTRQLYITTSRVYEQALAIAESITGQSDDVNRLKVVILNNLAQIHYFELAEYGSALEKLQQVKAIMNEFHDEGAAAFEFHSRDEIILNLLLTRPPATAGCA